MTLDSGLGGQWATDALTDAELCAPSLLPFEAGNIIRRHELAGVISADQAALAELLGTTLVTLALRIGRAPDLRCTLATP